MITLFNRTQNNFGLSEKEFQQMKLEFQQGDSPTFRRVCETQDVLLEFKKLVLNALKTVDRFDLQAKEDIALDCYIKWRDKVATEMTFKEFTRPYRNTMIYNYCTDLKSKKSPIWGYDDFLEQVGDRIQEDNEHALKELIEKVASGWELLGERCKKLLKRVDQDKERVGKLAIELDLTRTHLSTTLGDCRRKLAELSKLPLKIKGKNNHW